MYSIQQKIPSHVKKQGHMSHAMRELSQQKQMKGGGDDGKAGRDF